MCETVHLLYISKRIEHPALGQVPGLPSTPPFSSSVNYPSSFLISLLLLNAMPQSPETQWDVKSPCSQMFSPSSFLKTPLSLCQTTPAVGRTNSCYDVNDEWVAFLNAMPPILYLTGFIKDSHQCLTF